MGLLTLGKEPLHCKKQRGRPSPAARLSLPAKRRKIGFSVTKDVRLQNVGVHWPEFVGSRGRCEVCSSKQIESRPHSNCTTCKVFLCCNEKTNCFTEYHAK